MAGFEGFRDLAPHGVFHGRLDGHGGERTACKSQDRAAEH